MKNRIFVGLGEYVISKNASDELVTMALGSCVAVILASKNSPFAAMIHAVVPVRPKGVDSSKKNGYYVDKGLGEMIDSFLKGSREAPENILCWVIGGAISKHSRDQFEIGSKNVEEAKVLLTTYGIEISQQEVGGHVSRSVYFDVQTRKILIHQHEMII